MTDQALIPKDAEEGKNKGLSVDIDPDRLRHFFYMMNGEPSRRTESFYGAIAVSKGDVEILIDALIERLRLAHIRDYTIKIGVGFEKTIVEKSFTDFKEYRWNEPNKTKEVIIKINCMYKDYDTGNPLNHSLYIRIAKKINPSNMLQIISSTDVSKIDDLDSLMCPVFCRTDYLHDELSKSLMSAVSEWHKGQKQPPILSKSHSFVKKHKQRIARVIHFFYPLVAAFLCVSGIFISNALLAHSDYHLPALASLVVGANYLIMFFTAYGHRKAGKLFEYLAEISSQDVIFDITRGDDKDSSERINENIEAFSSARGVFLWSMVQNVTASIVAAIIWKWLV
jgi:hypothetical protein